MSRKPIGWRMPKPLADSVWSKRRSQDAMVHAAGGQEAADERIASPLKYAVPDFEWDPGACRYRWRKGIIRNGKNLSWHFHPVPDLERKQYSKRIQHRREDRERKKQRLRVQGP